MTARLQATRHLAELLEERYVVLLLLARRLGARRAALCSLGLSLCLMVATDAESQIIINGTALIFDSPDHSTVLPTGDPAVTHYVLEVWLPTSVASGTPLKTLDLGKPVASPGSTTITVNQAQFLLGLPAGQDYVATVRVVGPAGESRSGPSNSFIRLYGPTPTSTPSRMRGSLRSRIIESVAGSASPRIAPAT